MPQAQDINASQRAQLGVEQETVYGSKGRFAPRDDLAWAGDGEEEEGLRWQAKNMGRVEIDEREARQNAVNRDQCQS